MSILNKVFGKRLKKEKKAKFATDEKAANLEVVKKTEAKDEKKDEKTENKAESKSNAKKSNLKRDDAMAYQILKKPVITEKATYLAAFNKYIFAVPVSATKSEVKKKVQNVFGVKVVKVNMIKKSGKKVRYGRRTGRTKNWKKAIVTLTPGDKIEIYEGV